MAVLFIGPHGNKPLRASGDPEARENPRRRGPSRTAVVLVSAGTFAVVGVVLALLLVLPAIRAGQEAARRIRCKNNLRQIGLAMHALLTENGSFPAAYTADAHGRRLHSWRTAILPRLGQEDLHRQLRLREPWDSPANRPLTSGAQPLYACLSDRDSPAGRTSYVVITGPKTVFHRNLPCGPSSITDGLSNTLLVIEIEQSGIAWAEPRDLTEEEFLEGVHTGRLRSPHLEGFHVLMADGSIRSLPADTPADAWRRLIEKGDGRLDASHGLDAY